MPMQEERISVVLENEGQKIFGIYHKPVGVKSYPAVLICHGLGGNKCGKYRIYVNLATMLSAIGIAALRIDFRGSGDSEGAFSEMTLEGEMSDALKGLHFLLQDPHANSQRLGLFGRSLGGTVAVLAANHFDKVKSLAVWAPVFNVDPWMEKWHMINTMPLSEELRQNIMRINGQVPGYDFFKQLFSLKITEKIIALNHLPILHIHGEKDDIVAIAHAYDYLSERKNHAVETKALRLAESDHDFSHPLEQQLALEETCQWFARTL